MEIIQSKFIDNDFFSTVIYFDEETTVKSSVKSSQKILDLVKENTEITTDELARLVGIKFRLYETNLYLQIYFLP